eukprot:TRINITY_DN77668_c0_g1_i1.p1 TRINITY_DN77668_c0_g1~~TRINITY_DN77668_c0_g1_i1.p1  ORF type:complete len:101 (-),score=13.45 TRINITY_DN77668_c0_g1_i1:64-366(-)
MLLIIESVFSGVRQCILVVKTLLPRDWRAPNTTFDVGLRNAGADGRLQQTADTLCTDARCSYGCVSFGVCNCVSWMRRDPHHEDYKSLDLSLCLGLCMRI